MPGLFFPRPSWYLQLSPYLFKSPLSATTLFG